MKKLLVLLFIYGCSQPEVIPPESRNEFVFQFKDKEIIVPIDTVFKRQNNLYYTLLILSEKSELVIFSYTDFIEGNYSAFNFFIENDGEKWKRTEGEVTIFDINNGIDAYIYTSVTNGIDTVDLQGTIKYK